MATFLCNKKDYPSFTIAVKSTATFFLVMICLLMACKRQPLEERRSLVGFIEPENYSSFYSGDSIPIKVYCNCTSFINDSIHIWAKRNDKSLLIDMKTIPITGQQLLTYMSFTVDSGKTDTIRLEVLPPRPSQTQYPGYENTIREIYILPQ